MGIFGLFFFVSRDCEYGYQKVYLADIAKQYKEETGNDPVMLVDVSSFIRKLRKIERKIQVTLKVFQNKLETFINNCSEMGIRLKFIGEGIRPRKKYEVWISRTLQRYREQEEKYKYSDFLLESFMKTAETIYQTSDKCDFVRSVYEADDYIIRYAKTEGCFAIMSNDSDLLIAEGSCYFLNSEKLDLKSMSTYNYNRNSLAKGLGLRPSLLPVFASLCDTEIHGNEYFSKRARAAENPQLFLAHFRNLAEIIKKCPFSEGDFDELLNQITEKMTPEEANKVKNKFRFYSAAAEKVLPLLGNDHWSEILRAAERRHVTGISKKSLLGTLIDRVVFWAPKYIRPEFDIVQKLRPLREKTYGLLFSECPDNEVCVTEYTFIGESKNPKPKTEEVRFERRSHSGLLQLWSQDRSKEMMYERRRLFCETLDEKLTPAILDELNIPDELLFPVLALFYIRRHANSENPDIERKVVLTQAVLEDKIYKSGIYIRRRFPNIPAVLKLAEPFKAAIEHLELLNCVCGEPFSAAKTKLINYYDSDVFHFVYEREVKGRNFPKYLQIHTAADLCDLEERLEKLESTCGGAARNGE